jgi:hypothetical protein
MMGTQAACAQPPSVQAAHSVHTRLQLADGERVDARLLRGVWRTRRGAGAWREKGPFFFSPQVRFAMRCRTGVSGGALSSRAADRSRLPVVQDAAATVVHKHGRVEHLVPRLFNVAPVRASC